MKNSETILVGGNICSSCELRPVTDVDLDMCDICYDIYWYELQDLLDDSSDRDGI